MEGSRNETIADCGLRNGKVSSARGAAADGQTTALVRAAAALAEGKIAELKQRFVAARAAGVPDLWVEELLLQSLLLVGYPLALVAFGVWRAVTGPSARGGDSAAEELAHEEWQAWAERGAHGRAAGCGRAYPKRLGKTRPRHPAPE